MLPEENEIIFDQKTNWFYTQIGFFATLFFFGCYIIAKTRDQYLEQCAKETLAQEQ